MYTRLMGMMLMVSGVSYGAAVDAAARATKVKAFLTLVRGDKVVFTHDIFFKEDGSFFGTKKYKNPDNEFILDSDPKLIASTTHAPTLSVGTTLFYEGTAHSDSCFGLVRTCVEKDPRNGTLPQFSVTLTKEDTYGSLERLLGLVFRKGREEKYLMLPFGKIHLTHNNVVSGIALGAGVVAALVVLSGWISSIQKTVVAVSQ